MIRPLRKTIPWDSLPLSSVTMAAGAVVKNTANGLNISALLQINPGASYQTADWVICEGYDYFSLLLSSGIVGGGSNLEVMAVPVAASDPSQQLDGITWGSVSPTGYVRISQEMPNVFGFYLRFTNISTAIIFPAFLELQMCKR